MSLLVFEVVSELRIEGLFRKYMERNYLQISKKLCEQVPFYKYATFSLLVFETV